jgi:Pyridoxamine 5'-phosphate oxidase
MEGTPRALKQEGWYDSRHSGGMSEEELRTFLDGPQSDWIMKLACLDEDGWPYVTPMWYQWDGEHFYAVGRRKSAWVGFLQRDPRCMLCIDETAMPPHGALRKVLARCEAEVVEGPVVAEGSRWLPIANQMAMRYAGEAGVEGLKGSYSWPRHLVRFTPVDKLTTWQGVDWASRYKEDADA